MRGLARFSVSNAVVVNLATLTLVFGGLTAYFGMPREVFPEFSLGTVEVTTVYPGASPVDVERLVTLPLEEKLEGIDGRRDLTSQSQEGISIVTLTVETGADTDDFLEDVRAAVQSGDLELPDEAEDPFVREVKSEFPVIAVFVYGSVSDEELRVLADREKRQLERIPGVARVLQQGVREPRIWVEVDPAALERFGLDLAQVGAAVGARSTDAPLGSLTTPSGDFLLRVDSLVQRAEDLRDATVIERADGTRVRLADVARVREAQERTITRARFNGRPSVYLQVNKSSTGDAVAISKAVHARVAEAQGDLPPGAAVGTNSDLSIYIENRLRTMQSSATLGGMLVLIALLCFLNLRVALMTALGIPVSFLGGLMIAHAVGISMNMMTMFALIVVLGMIVDDAIVVGENVFRHMEEGLSPREAAIRGTMEVAGPVTATILTTIAAFLPTLLIGGTMGMFLRPLPLIVTFCLFASLVEALMVLPAHLAHWTGKGVAARAAVGHEGESARDARAPSRWYDPLRAAYVHLLELALRWRYATVALVTGVAVLLLGLAIYRIPFVLFDDFESQVFSVNVRTVPGTSIEETDRVTTALEERIAELPEDELASTNLVAGASYIDASRYSLGHHLAQVWVELREGVPGRRSTAAIIEDVRARIADGAPEIESVDVTQPQAGPAGRAIDVAVRGPDLDVLDEIAADLKERLAGFRGVRDVRDNGGEGKREVRVTLTDEGRLLGFDEAGLARELRAAFEGTRYARVRRGKDDVEILVKLPEELRYERGGLARLRVPLPLRGPSLSAGLSEGAPSGTAGDAVSVASTGRGSASVDAPSSSRPSTARGAVPLGSIASLREESAPVSITRDDGERSIRVSADVNKTEGNAAKVVAALQEHYADLPQQRPGYSVEFKGEHQDTQESFQGLGVALALSLFLIYMILGGLFRSLLQPFVIMTAIPFGFVGMVLGHLIMGRVLSFMSVVGLVALSGIVVNDSLILIDFVNARRREGAGLMQALVVAGRQRFRPILLTSITTMLGLSPLTFFASGQARFLQPMAITVFFGLLFSTLLILVVVPCVYALVEDLRLFVRHPRAVWSSWKTDRPVPEDLRPASGSQA